MANQHADIAARARKQAAAGFTLLELTLAMAIFAVVLGVTAQSLVTYYTSIQTQNQRTLAAQNLKAVFAEMRALRDQEPEDFPANIVDEWPDGSDIERGSGLMNENIRVTYTDPNANPLEVMLVHTWDDNAGRTVRLQMSTMLTNQ